MIEFGPIVVSPISWWIYMFRRRKYFGLFRNLPGVRTGRWGFYVLGFEFGSRTPGDCFGMFLERMGLWPFVGKE